MRLPLFILFLFFYIAACTNAKKEGSTDAVFADYKISGDEETGNITCLLKFHNRNSRGAALFLEPPASVSLDGIAVPSDSAGLSGAYYEIQIPVHRFAGIHTIVFKSAEGKEYKETFNFQPFTIANDFPETIARADFSLNVDGLKPAEPVRVLLTDTSFATPDINEIDTVRNGELRISQNALRNVNAGPVTLHLFTEVERQLQEAPSGGGKLSITYGLSREFELVDE